jgi:hypothetical protein
MPDTADPPRRDLWRSFRARLPILAAQVFSVVFAVLVALAVDEWWEDRENAELGRRGMAAVAAEISRNLEELQDGFTSDTMLTTIDSVIADLQAEREPGEVSINYPVALLSDAAWETAQVTRAVHFVPLESVIRIARLYDLQEFFARNQEVLTEQIATMGLGSEAELLESMRALRARYRIVVGFRQALMDSYACSLAELAGHDPESQEECEALATPSGR